MKPTKIEQLILTVILWVVAACFFAGCATPPALPPVEYADVGAQVVVEQDLNGAWYVCVDTPSGRVVRRVVLAWEKEKKNNKGVK